MKISKVIEFSLEEMLKSPQLVANIAQEITYEGQTERDDTTDLTNKLAIEMLVKRTDTINEILDKFATKEEVFAEILKIKKGGKK